MLRQGFRHSFSPCVRSGEVLAFTGSRMDALRRTGLGGGRSVCLFAGKNKKNIQAYKYCFIPHFWGTSVKM